MKKIILLLFLMINSSLIYAINRDDDETTEVVKLETSVAENERSFNNVQCSIDRNQKIIEVDFVGSGIPMVTLQDLYGNIYACQYGTSNVCRITIILPDTEGTYCITVQSSGYRGDGFFSIY